MVEHYAGNFPVWLSPIQAIIIPIGLEPQEYAKRLKDKLEEKSIRVKLDDRNETLNKRIRGAEVEKIPYILVVGRKEADSGQVSVRKKGKGDIGLMSTQDLITKIEEEIKNKS